jgi:hypothetical protein
LDKIQRSILSNKLVVCHYLLKRHREEEPSKLKEATMSHKEALELIYLLEKEKSMALEEQGGDSMLVFAISSLIAYVNEY